MAQKSPQNESLVDDYVDGRMDESQRQQFEEQLRQDPELRRQVRSTTQSLELFRSVVNPGEAGTEFESQVSNKIIQITQSNPGLRPVQGRRVAGQLTAADPEARLLMDPDAAREKQRLMLIALLAGVFFVAAVALIALVFLK